MYLQKLNVSGIRNLKPVQLSFASRVNFFYGNNGSGKTSFLEAIYLLGRGRSFRTRNPLTVMTRDADELLSVGFLGASDDRDGAHQGLLEPTKPSGLPINPAYHSNSNPTGQLVTVGVQRRRNGDFSMKVAGEAVYSSSSLAAALPLLLLNADSFSLLEGGPSGRRRYLDWGVFHVEQRYRELWKRFQRALKQRNSLLRRDRMDAALLSTWDGEFVALAEQIDSFRKVFAEQLIPLIKAAFTMLGGGELSAEIVFSYYSGWDTDRSLASILLEDRQRDFQGKVTHHGPHRADLKVRLGRKAAAELLSRGQIKILVSAMQIAQGQLFYQLTKQRCVYLLDDLPAELDERHRKAVGQLLSDMGAQVFITGVDKRDLLGIWPEVVDGCVGLFHVEHGEVSPQNLS